MSKLILSFVFLAVFACAFDALHLDQGANPLEKTLFFNLHHLSEAIFQKLSPKNDENVIYSPLSIMVALSMVLKGAKGETYNELAKAINLKSANSDDVQLAIKKLLESYKQNSNKRDVTIELANALFAANSKPIKQEYKAFIESNYGAKVENVDFANKGAEVLKTINDFVKEKTHGKIAELYKQPLPAETVALLLNTLYFKGKFEQPFMKESTQKGKFYNSDKTESDVDFMREESLSYEHKIDPKTNLTYLVIPYKGNVTLSILFSNDKNGIYEKMTKLPANDLYEVLTKTEKKRVPIKLPKFKIEGDLNLKKILKEIGVKEMFKPTADLSDIEKGVYVDDVKHKATIEVDEHGTEAAAVTAIRGATFSLYNGPRIVVDRSFYFFIYDYTQQTMLFTGIVNKL